MPFHLSLPFPSRAHRDADEGFVYSTGFAVAGEYEDPKIKEAQTAAFDQMLSWLKAH